MSETMSGLGSHAAALAEAFDRSFSMVRSAEVPAWSDFLAVRIGGDPYALPLGELGEITPLGRVTPLPDAPAACLGLAGLRSVITPVYDLRALLDYTPVPDSARWLATLAHASVAVAFDAIEGHLRLPASAVAPHEPDGRLVRDAVRTEAGLRPILDIPAALSAIGRLAGRTDPTSDH